MINSPDVFVNQEQLNVAQSFICAIKEHDFKNAANINDILVVLDKLFIRFGYTIGCYEVMCLGNTHYVLYPHKINANLEFIPEYVDEKVETPDEVTIQKTNRKRRPRPKLDKVLIPFDFNPDYKIVGYQEITLKDFLPSIFHYVNVPYTKEGIWQLYLLHYATDYFPLGWHCNYRRKNRIFSLNDIDVIDEIDCSCYRNASILPAVYFIDSNRAVVECSYFSLWSGLCREFVCFDRTSGFFEVTERERKVLIEYDCGIRY